MNRRTAAAIALAAALLVPGLAAAHELDHPATPFSPPGAPNPAFQSGGDGARWELLSTIPTGNPHTDLDFFMRGGETFASVGTLAIGPNSGGQTIVQLTQGGEVDPRIASQHPSASCLSNPAAALGLQHDVEATPKSGAILNSANQIAPGGDAQLIVDATDQRGRCHDQDALGLSSSKRGGLEIVDVTDPSNPVEIGMTSHIGESHTVNIDPKRPHIAYAVTSDAIGVTPEGQRLNEDPSTPPPGGRPDDRNDLDGWEVVDLSSCMNFPAGTTVQQKRDACRPKVYRYRYPSVEIARGHTQKSGDNGVFGCHELELYPIDRLTCGGGNAGILFDIAGAFDDNGTPSDFTDDKPRGDPLPCAVRQSASKPGPFQTDAMVTDCVVGEGGVDLRIPNWIAIGAPSLTGVQHLGSAFHQGRGAGGPASAHDSTQDIDFNHEAELSGSGITMLSTDERGGGVQPPGASCAPGADIKIGNGGIHAHLVSRLDPSSPPSAEEAWDAYARTPAGDKAIYRAQVRTQPEASICTAHVFQQIPGQNRIFMGWYSQGTQVVDFIEHADGTFEFKEAGFFIPANANTWTSHVFRHHENSDGTHTYYGATGDFNLAAGGRNATDIFKVTLPAPPRAAAFRKVDPGTGCQSATRPAGATARRGAASIGARVTRRGRPIRNATVRAVGAGFRRTARTNRNGEVQFNVTTRRRGRVRLTTGAACARLRVSATKQGLAITHRAVALSARGFARVRVSCRSARPCRGRITLRRGRRIVGQRPFAIRAARRGIIPVAVSASVRRAVAGRGSVRLAARATLSRRIAGQRVARSSFRLVRSERGE